MQINQDLFHSIRMIMAQKYPSLARHQELEAKKDTFTAMEYLEESKKLQRIWWFELPG